MLRPARPARSVAIPPRRLCSPEAVYGRPVFDERGHQLGSVHHLLVDLRSGHVAYAIVATGGFLGLGETRFPVAWPELDIAADGSRLVWRGAQPPGTEMPASVPAALLGP